MNTGATIAEARRLWQAVGRENLMIKVPATKSGLPAIRQLTGEGISWRHWRCCENRPHPRSASKGAGPGLRRRSSCGAGHAHDDEDQGRKLWHAVGQHAGHLSVFSGR
jgi:hypothetical protein